MKTQLGHIKLKPGCPQGDTPPIDDESTPNTLLYGWGVPLRAPWLLISVLLLIAALWLYMSFTAATHETPDQHVYRIGAQLKCPICQGESVADSSSTLAQQMRGIIREKIQQGQSDQQIIQFFSDRYGSQIVWAPQWWGFSLLAWLVPIALLLGGLMLIFFTLRDWHTSIGSGTTNTVQKARGTSQLASRGREEEAELVDLDEEELARYRTQLERELAADDVLFERSTQNETQLEAR